jgi:hypothetical protein
VGYTLTGAASIIPGRAVADGDHPADDDRPDRADPVRAVRQPEIPLIIMFSVLVTVPWWTARAQLTGRTQRLVGIRFVALMGVAVQTRVILYCSSTSCASKARTS